MQFYQTKADIYVPDGTDAAAALKRTTELCVAAHQDDIEIMAHSAIAACYNDPRRSFTGVVVTDGAGSPRTGRYAHLTDAEMPGVRRDEQRAAAKLGKYGLQLQLAHPSAAVKASSGSDHRGVCADLELIFGGCSPDTVYLHNPADKHDTHIAVLWRCLEALRALPAEKRPRRVLGVEVWRGLDWILDTDKVLLDASAQPALAEQLLLAFDSQISGGKRYDLAALGRRRANATFHTSHATDRADAVVWALDLTPVVADPTRDLADYTLAYVDRLRADVSARLARWRSGT